MSEPHVGRFFLVGTPRSGTTLFQCILAAHSQVLSLPETQFFLDLEPKRNRIARALKLVTPPGRRNYRRFHQWARQFADVRLPQHPFFIRQHTNAFVRLFDTAARRQGKTHWLEKSPIHLRSIDVIKRYVPNARFIHLVRRGSDNIASLYDVGCKNPEWWGKQWTLEYCTQFWLDDIRITLRHLGDPAHLVVTYNEIVSPPHPGVLRACEFMKLPFEPAMLVNYSLAAERVVDRSEVWKAGVRQTIRSQDGAKFHQLLTPEQQQYVLQRVSEIDLSPLGLT